MTPASLQENLLSPAETAGQPSVMSDKSRSGSGAASAPQTVKDMALTRPAFLVSTLASPQLMAARMTRPSGRRLVISSRSEAMTAMPPKAMAAPMI